MSGEDDTLLPDPVIEYYKRFVDRTLIRENLRRSVEERLANLMALQESAEELRRTGIRAKEKRESER